MWYLDKNSLNIVYISIFFILSVALYLVSTPSAHEYKGYKFSKRVLSIAFFIVSVIGALSFYFPPVKGNPFTDFVVKMAVCHVFTYLNYLSFLFMIETDKNRRLSVMKISAVLSPIVVGLCICGYILPKYAYNMEMVISALLILAHFIILTGCLREYDKFILLINNYDGTYPNFRWIPVCLWATFIVAFITVLSFFNESLISVAGLTALLIYTFLSIKLLSFIPENIHLARDTQKSNEIVVEEHNHKHNIMETVAEFIEHEVQQEQQIQPENSQKSDKKYEKVAPLLQKWVESGSYMQPKLNIKEVASQMGTNSFYLSSYINNVLETSFAVWLNTLRIEKSKEYLMSGEKISMEECGMKVGYETLYNYSRWFKVVTGVSPSVWKRNHRNSL